tara:strand:+ start:387 stop:584 length:198 start_codon:yes stop_codon:yes gene_type:complete
MPRIPDVPEPRPAPAPPPPTPVAKRITNVPRKKRRQQQVRGNPLVIDRSSAGVNTGGMQSGAGLY